MIGVRRRQVKNHRVHKTFLDFRRGSSGYRLRRSYPVKGFAYIRTQEIYEIGAAARGMEKRSSAYGLHHHATPYEIAT
ncbi:hypothetical protein [Dyella humi]|uniref:hypothetical protein n=1 Tax=Dyella humi TaxID=1770547 RepID=UPI0036D33460